LGLLGGDVQFGGQLGVAPGGSVVVTICGRPGTMTETGHDLFGRGSLLGEQRSGRMSQTVRVELGHPACCPTLAERLVPVHRRDRPVGPVNT